MLFDQFGFNQFGIDRQCCRVEEGQDGIAYDSNGLDDSGKDRRGLTPGQSLLIQLAGVLSILALAVLLVTAVVAVTAR